MFLPKGLKYQLTCHLFELKGLSTQLTFQQNRIGSLNNKIYTIFFRLAVKTVMALLLVN